MLKLIVAFFLTLPCVSVLAQTEDDFELLKQVAPLVINKYQFELPAKPRLAIVHRPERTPVAATTSPTKGCIVILNTNKKSWRQWNAFFERQTLTKEEVFEFALLHEVGHCVNKVNPSPFEPGADSEAFADAYAFSLLKQTLTPKDYLRHLDAIIESRKNMGFMALFTGHDTSETLNLIRAEHLAQAKTGLKTEQPQP